MMSKDTIKDGDEVKANPHKDKLEKLVLKNALKGPARQWYNKLAANTSFEDCLESLRSRFTLTDQQIHSRKLKICRMTQEPGESCTAFVDRILTNCRGLGMTDPQLVQIIIQGAGSHIRPFLMLNSPKTVEDLLKMSVVRDEDVLLKDQLEFANACTATVYDDDNKDDWEWDFSDSQDGE